MKNAIRNYDEDIKINENNIEEMWLEQPSLNMYYNDLYAASIFVRDRCKIQTEYIYAQLDTKIRQDWKSFGFESKPTETAIKNKILMQDEYKKIIYKTLKASKDANLMAGVKTSFEHRKHALSNIVSLRISGFHSEPRNIIKDIKNKKVSENHLMQKQNLKRRKKKQKD
ncbi:MAG: hypothetical protein ACTSXL_02045 [Alphaproteobacteria bacterium]